MAVHWPATRQMWAAHRYLAPGTLLHRHFTKGRRGISPEDLVDGIFDTKLKLKVDRMGLDPQDIRNIGAWIIETLHGRQSDAEQLGPYGPPPIGNLRAYAWRMFSRQAAALPPAAALVDEEQQAQNVFPELQPQEGEMAAGARDQILQQGRQSDGSAASSSMLDKEQYANNSENADANLESAPAGLDDFAAGFQAAADYLLLGDQRTQDAVLRSNEPEDHTAEDVVAVPRYQLERLMNLLSHLFTHVAKSGAA